MCNLSDTEEMVWFEWALRFVSLPHWDVTAIPLPLCFPSWTPPNQGLTPINHSLSGRSDQCGIAVVMLIVNQSRLT